MTKYYRIVFEEYDSKPCCETQDNIILEGEVSAPDSCLDFGIRHAAQMELISKAQDKILQLQAREIPFKDNCCPKCTDGLLKKHGFNTSWFYDIFSDHRVTLPRVYQPNSIIPNTNNTRNTIASKHCAASAMSDSQEQMKRRTIIAALKQGMTPKTKITALCDGADNCWNIIDALEPMAASIDRILDWFHLGMKIQNIPLPEAIKPKLVRIKWHLWRGNSDRAIQRLTSLITSCSGVASERLSKLKTYIENNASKIINYRERQKKCFHLPAILLNQQ